MSTGTKVCPHCGGKMFAAKIIRGCIVEATEDGGFKVLKENTDKHDIEVIKCGRCKNELTNDALITGVACKECGKVVNPKDVNADGVCSICQAQKERTELANASREDLIRMLLDAERKAKFGDAVPNPNPPSFTPDIADTTTVSEEQVETPVEVTEDKKEKGKTQKRGASRKKAAEEEPKTEQTEESADTGSTEAANESISKESTVAAEVDAIADQQTAPFPDIPVPEMDVMPTSAMNPPEEPDKKEEQFGVSQFEMFQSEESF